MPDTYPTDLDLKAFLYAAGLINSATNPTGRFASLDYESAVDAAKVAFERESGRVIRATEQTLVFDGPANRKRRLWVPDCLAVTEVTFLDVEIAASEWMLGPVNNDALGLPYAWIDFFRAWEGPTPWAQRSALAVTGTFGYSETVPADVFQAILARAAADLMVQVSSRNSGGGLNNWSEADVLEDYGLAPGQNIEDRWRGVYARAVASYRNFTRGLGRYGF